MNLQEQIVRLFLLAIPVACIAWTVTHEEVFREPREYCAQKSKTCDALLKRKFFYLFTCEYCFSHYITLFFVIITGYTLLYDDWRGYLISFFAVVWIANFYMTIFGLLRQGLKEKKMDASIKKIELEEIKENLEDKSGENK